MTFYTELERLTKSAKEGGFQKVGADVDVVAQLCEKARAEERKAGPAEFSTWAGREGYDTAQTYDTERSRWVFLNPMTADLWKAWRAALGTQPVKETNHG
jgi:hypothetical protein